MLSFGQLRIECHRIGCVASDIGWIPVEIAYSFFFFQKLLDECTVFIIIEPYLVLYLNSSRTLHQFTVTEFQF